MTSGSREFRAVGQVLWQLRYDLLAVLVVATAMVPLSAVLPMQGAAALVPLLGVVVSIFIGFRNSNAFSRWWEARTLWGTVVANCRAVHNALTAVDDCSTEMAVTTDRMRRRQVRHAWQLAAELQGVSAASAVRELTPEDPPDATSGVLLNLQAADTRDLVRADRIDRQGRVILTNLNTAQATAAGGLERIRNQPIPPYYAGFVRALAWLFAILVCTRVDAGGHHSIPGIVVGVLVMALFVVAERIGHITEAPLSNSPFALPMAAFCAGITADLLGRDHPLSDPTSHHRSPPKKVSTL
jgi:putative membrane protein